MQNYWKDFCTPLEEHLRNIKSFDGRRLVAAFDFLYRKLDRFDYGQRIVFYIRQSKVSTGFWVLRLVALQLLVWKNSIGLLAAVWSPLAFVERKVSSQENFCRIVLRLPVIRFDTSDRGSLVAFGFRLLKSHRGWISAVSVASGIRQKTAAARLSLASE